MILFVSLLKTQFLYIIVCLYTFLYYISTVTRFSPLINAGLLIDFI